MKKAKKAAVLSALLLSGATLTLTGCNEKEAVNNEKSQNEAYNNSETFEYYIEEPEVRICKPYEHCLFKSYSAVGLDSYKTRLGDEGSIYVPEGYMVLAVNSSHMTPLYNTVTEVEVWFTNIETVEVKPVYNEYINAYDYGEFGTVVDMNYDQDEEYELKRK